MKSNIIEINKKKITRIKVLFIIISLLLPFLNVPVIYAEKPGEATNFEMRIENEGLDILGTVIYKIGYEGVGALDSDINIPVNIFFSNVSQVVSNNETMPLDSYYWRAESKDSDIAKVEIVGTDYLNAVFGNGDKFCHLVLTPQSLGTAVISIDVSSNKEMDNPVTKTFTVSIVDAAKHGEAEPAFVRIGGAPISAGIPLQIGYTNATTVSIDKLIGYDIHSNLKSGAFTKAIANYSWHASLNRSDVIRINDALSISNQKITNGKAEANSSQNIVITPLKEGIVDINFTFVPEDIEMVSIFGNSISYTMTVNVTKVVGAFDFVITSDKRAYGRGTEVNGENNFGMSIESNLAFADNIDPMFRQDTTEPPTPEPTTAYDANSPVDVMFQNKPQETTEVNPNLVPSATTNNSNNSVRNNSDVDINSAIDIMFQVPVEPQPSTEETTEPYDSNSPVDIMFQNGQNENRPTQPPTTIGNNFVPNPNSSVDVMFQTPTEPTTPEPTEPTYDINSPVDVMFQNIQPAQNFNPNANPNPNTNPNLIPNPNGNNLYGDIGISPNAAGLGNSFGSVQDFTAGGNTVGGDREVILTLSTFRSQINGVWQDVGENIPFEIKEISYRYPSIITNPSAKKTDLTEIIINDEWELAYHNSQFFNDKQTTIVISDIAVQESFDVAVSIKAEIYGDVKTASKTFNVFFLTDEENGSIVNVSLMQDWEVEITEKQAITGIIGRNQTDAVLNFGIAGIDIVDFTTEDNIVTIFDLSNYEFSVKSSSPNVVDVIMPNLDENDYYTFKLELKRTGKSNITVVVANIFDPTKTYTRTFTVNVTDGVLSSEEGAISSVLMRRGQETIYDGRTNLYMLPESEMKIDIVRVMEYSSAAKASDNYTRELKNYSWEAVSDNSTIGISEGMYRNIDSNSSAEEKSITIVSGDYTDEAIITIIFDSDREDVSSKSPYVFTFRVIVNGIGGSFLPVINYERETIRIATDIHGGNYQFYDFDHEKGAEYMYSLRAANDGASQANEKWFPFMGDEMDISALIPKSGSTAYRLGVRLANDVEREENGNYPSSVRQVVPIPPRRVLSKSEKGEIVYKNEQIMLNASGASEIDIYYQVGLSDWLKATISGTKGISFPSSIAPMGVVVQIKYAADSGDGNQASNFGSAPIKIRVPKAGTKPNIKRNDSKGTYSGFTTKMEYSVDGKTWKESPKGAISYKDLKSRFGELLQDSESDNYALYLRTKASYKKDGSLKNPASDIVVLKIPAAIYE